MGSLEDAIAFRQIEKYLDDEQKRSITKAMGMSLDEINQRLLGKKKEDEFILILLFLDICKKMSAFDEAVSKLVKQTYTPDLSIELKNGRKFFLEIKHTDRDEYRISSGNLQKRIDYAKTYGLDLYFAISIKGFWMLFESDFVVLKKGRITVSDWKHSKLDDMLGTYGYLFPPNICIKSVYSKNRDEGLGIYFNEYGNLISYELKYENRRIFRVKGKNSPYKGYSMILEALQDRLSSINQDVLKDGEYSIISEYDNGTGDTSVEEGYNIISEYSFLLAPVMHTCRMESRERVDVDGIVSAMKSDEIVPHFCKEHIRGLMSRLVDMGIPICYLHNDNIYKLPGQKELENEGK